MHLTIDFELRRVGRMVSRLLCVCVGASMGGGFAAIAQEETSAARPLLETQVFNDGDHLLAPVSVDGKTYRFVVDTGSTATVYDSSLREQLGPAVGRGVTNVPGRDVEFVRPAKVAIGGLPIVTDGMVVDLEPLRRTTGNDFRGVLGMDFLAQHIVAIDPDRGTFSLLRSVPTRAGEKLAIQFRHALPYIRAAVPGFEGELFMLDTGMDGGDSGYLRADLAAALLAKRLASRSHNFGKSVDGFGSVSSKESLVLSRLTVAGIEHRSLRFQSAGEDNILGLGMLIRYRVVFDFPNKTAYFTPSRFFRRRDKPDVCGMHFRRIGRSVHVDSVDRYSPVWQAGIEPDDIVLSIGPRDCAATRLYCLRVLLRDEGETVPVVVQRGERRLTY